MDGLLAEKGSLPLYDCSVHEALGIQVFGEKVECFRPVPTASLQLVLTGQAASTRTSGLCGKPSTPALGLLSSPDGRQCDQLLVPVFAGAEGPGVCTVTGVQVCLLWEQALTDKCEGLNGSVLDMG